MSNLNFCMYTTQLGPVTKKAVKADEMPASPYHWPKAFRGDLVTVHPQFDPEKYDVVYIDAYTLNLPLVADIRAKIGWESSTKIVADIDWGQDHWWKQYLYPNTFKREILNADIIFHVSNYYCRNLERFLQHKVYYNPHPMRWETYRYHCKKFRKNAIVVLGHHYEHGKFWLPWLAIWDTPLVKNFNNHIEKDTTNALALYDIVTGPMNFNQWIKHLAVAKCAMETYQLPCASRAVYEAAALEVPVVGSKYVEDLAFCFPDLTCEPNDMTCMHEKIERLRTDDKFWQECVDLSVERSKFYNYENSVKRFKAMLDDNEDRREERKLERKKEVVKVVKKEGS